MPSQGSTKARGYGTRHVKARKQAVAKLRDGDPCTRCGRPMFHHQQLDLDHTDDRSGYLGLAHSRCNRLAGARKGGKVTAARYPGRWKARRRSATATVRKTWRSREW